MRCYRAQTLPTSACEGVRNTDSSRRDVCFLPLLQLREAEQIQGFSNPWSAEINSKKTEVMVILCSVQKFVSKCFEFLALTPAVLLTPRAPNK